MASLPRYRSPQPQLGYQGINTPAVVDPMDTSAYSPVAIPGGWQPPSNMTSPQDPWNLSGQTAVPPTGLGINPEYSPVSGGGMGWGLDGNGGNSPAFSNATAEFGADTVSGLGGSNAGWNPFAVNEQGLNGLGMTNFQTASAGIGLLTSGVNAYSALQNVGLAKKQFKSSQDQWNKTWGAQTKIHNNQVASDARFADAYSGTNKADERIKERSI